MKKQILKKIFAVIAGLIVGDIVQKRMEKILKVDDIKFGFGITF